MCVHVMYEYVYASVIYQYMYGMQVWKLLTMNLSKTVVRSIAKNSNNHT